MTKSNNNRRISVDRGNYNKNRGRKQSNSNRRKSNQNQGGKGPVNQSHDLANSSSTGVKLPSSNTNTMKVSDSWVPPTTETAPEGFSESDRIH